MPPTDKFGIITGLMIEARCISRSVKSPRILLFCSGANPQQAEQGAGEMAENGATALLSFGLAGGLDPALSPGDVLLPEKIIDPDGNIFSCDPALREKLAPHCNPAPGGLLYGTDTPVLSGEEKRRLHEKTGAAGVDMESHIVGRVAAEKGIPFIALRIISDPAWRDVPPCALSGIGKGGETQPLAVMGSLLRRPQDLPGLLRLAFDNQKAMKRLSRVGDSLATLFL